jgi:Zn-dependent M28 family amino/carboxypeptidase
MLVISRWFVQGTCLLPLLLIFAGLGCSGGKSASSAAASSAPQQDVQTAASQPPHYDEPQEPARHVDAEKAMQYTREIVAFGPRWDGSLGQQRIGAYIHEKLRNDQVEEDAFVADTPAGKISMRNIVAKFPGAKDGIIVLGSHIDTNYPLRKTRYVGANDGACTTALLLALADQLRGKKLPGYSVWLAFFDGEEAIKEWSDSDSLYGSRHLAAKWQQDGTIRKIKGLLLADMIGDADLDIIRDKRSTEWLEDLVYEAASRLGYQSYFFADSDEIIDDHAPFANAGVPVADLIDYTYGYNNVYHHTTDDTLDKLSVKSLRVSGDVILEAIRLLNVNADRLAASPGASK